MKRVERVDKLLSIMTTKQLLDALISAMSDDEANEILDYIVRMHNIKEELL